MPTPDCSDTIVTDLTAYRDTIIKSVPAMTPYKEGYVDALNMALFLANAAIHRATMAILMEREELVSE